MPNHSLPKQRGVVLFFALIALVAITLAAVGLMRSRDTSVVIAGNIAFRQSASAGADRAIETARAWLVNNQANLENTVPVSGYYSAVANNIDVTGYATKDSADNVDWDGTIGNGITPYKIPGAADPLTGLSYAYIINRLCSVPNKPATDPSQDCSNYYVDTYDPKLASKSGGGYGSGALSSALQIYYRITVRVTGPKNTTSYIQAVVLI